MNLEQEKFELFSKRVKSLWNNWDIRVFVLCSLFVQILLIFFAVVRKRTANKLLILFTWSLYLLADWVADFALGLLANSQGNDSDCSSSGNELGVKIMASSSGGSKHANDKSTSANMRAFWAPFLLLHLGGPDTITAFAMEDNELWLRHLLGVLFEVGAAGYVFLLSLPKNKLLIPTLLIFVAGIVKYVERTYSLYLASMDGFRDSMLGDPDPGPNYAKLMEEYQSQQDSGIPAIIDISPEPKATEKPPMPEDVDQLKAASKALKLFDTFKGLIVEIMFSFHDRAESRSGFLCWKANDAFRVIEYELEFVYEVLFTKGALMHTKRGYVLRAVCSCSIMAAFFFFFSTSKHEHDKLDVAISYTLLGGAIALDTLALFMLTTSDIALVKLSKLIPRCDSFASWIIKWPEKRWSESTTQYNLIHQCLPQHQYCFRRIADRPTCCWKVFKCLTRGKIADLFDKLKYTSLATVSGEMKDFIFEQFMKKAKIVNDPKAARSLCSCRGSWVLEQRGYMKHFRQSIDTDFDESLLMWHVATTLCYYTEEDDDKAPKDNNKAPGRSNNEASAAAITKPENTSTPEKPKPGTSTTKPENTTTPEDQIAGTSTITPKDDKSQKSGEDEDVAVPTSASVNRRLSKQISDYMIYLLIMEPAMMSSAAVAGKIRFRDTCEEAKNFFLRRLRLEGGNPNFIESLCRSGEEDDKELQERLKRACHELLSVNTEAKPIDVKGDRSKSVLFDGCILAKKLKTELEVATRWIIMGEVWVEMLGHAAGRCNGIAHAQKLSKGGELLTFVWFLMAHLGLGEQYRIEAGHARAKLIVGK